MSFKVYKHTSPSGKVYIGITGQDNPKRRWCGGNGYHKNDYFRRAIAKYGWDNFEHEILYEGLTQKEAEQKEIELITKYNSANPSFGYNLDNGGSYAGKHSEQTREKIRNTLTGRKLPEDIKKHISEGHKRYFQENGHHCAGKKLSEDHKNKISEGLKKYYSEHEYTNNFSGENNPMYGKHHSEESNRKNMLNQPNRKMVVQLNKDTLEPIQIFDSAKQASKTLNTGHGNICKACKETHRVVKGYKWRYYDEYIKEGHE